MATRGHQLACHEEGDDVIMERLKLDIWRDEGMTEGEGERERKRKTGTGKERERERWVEDERSNR